jgi:hypothetical protein
MRYEEGNMIRSLFLAVILVTVSGCAPRYTWVNDAYSTSQMNDHFAVDEGECISEANYTYPDPMPIEDPDNAYFECMAYNRRYSTYSGTNEDGEHIQGTIVTTGDPYACNPTFEERQNYREYEEYVRQQRSYRTDYIESCLLIKGWEKNLVEENTD